MAPIHIFTSKPNFPMKVIQKYFMKGGGHINTNAITRLMALVRSKQVKGLYSAGLLLGGGGH